MCRPSTTSGGREFKLATFSPRLMAVSITSGSLGTNDPYSCSQILCKSTDVRPLNTGRKLRTLLRPDGTPPIAIGLTCSQAKRSMSTGSGSRWFPVSVDSLGSPAQLLNRSVLMPSCMAILLIPLDLLIRFQASVQVENIYFWRPCCLNDNGPRTAVPWVRSQNWWSSFPIDNWRSSIAISCYLMASQLRPAWSQRADGWRCGIYPPKGLRSPPFCCLSWKSGRQDWLSRLLRPRRRDSW